jgi:putative addiction module killer protein
MVKKTQRFTCEGEDINALEKLENEEHFGDFKPVGDGVNELRINYGKGYRIYYKEQNGKIILLLIGGDKSSQQRDIKKAKELASQI